MPMMRGMQAEPAPREAVSQQFDPRGTLLVLLATAGAAGALIAYRVVRLRSRPAASAVNEAVLVVDLVESTHIATHYGDTLAMRARNALKDVALTSAERHGVTFVENTGDGWFMTFPSVTGALDAATNVLRDLRERPPDLSPAPPIEARAAITYGEILLDARGGRHGAAINKAFRLVSLSAAQVARVEDAAERPAVPDRNRILMDEEAVEELRAVEMPHRFVGFCHLKGFSGLHGVYEMPWGERPREGPVDVRVVGEIERTSRGDHRRER
jgi:class 3 adenylate cyclase